MKLTFSSRYFLQGNIPIVSIVKPQVRENKIFSEITNVIWSLTHDLKFVKKSLTLFSGLSPEVRKIIRKSSENGKTEIKARMLGKLSENRQKMKKQKTQVFQNPGAGKIVRKS